jgi:Ala-tRNA(Pro) deacylase
MPVSGPDAYDDLVRLLDEGGARYRLIDHPAEGRTERASRLRGHSATQAAKSMVVEIRVKKRTVRYMLAVIPGMLRLDLELIRQVTGGRRAALARPATAERLTGCVVGSIVPFARPGSGLELIADPWLLRQPELYFNAARLDRSVVLRTCDYVEMAHPRLEPVAALPRDDSQGG